MRGSGNLVHNVGLTRLDHLGQSERRSQTDCYRIDALTGSTFPGTEPGGMRAGLMLRMVIGMGDRRCRQEPVHEHEAEQQRPHEPGLFQSHHHRVIGATRP